MAPKYSKNPSSQYPFILATVKRPQLEAGTVAEWLLTSRPEVSISDTSRRCFYKTACHGRPSYPHPPQSALAFFPTTVLPTSTLAKGQECTLPSRSVHTGRGLSFHQPLVIFVSFLSFLKYPQLKCHFLWERKPFHILPAQSNFRPHMANGFASIRGGHQAMPDISYLCCRLDLSPLKCDCKLSVGLRKRLSFPRTSYNT